MHPTVIVALVFLGVVTLVLIWAALTADRGDADGRRLTILTLMLGLLLGYAVGMLKTPLNAEEKLAFSELEQTMAALVSGYLLGKIDMVITPALSKPLERTTVYRVLIFVTAVLAAALCVFIVRAYAL